MKVRGEVFKSAALKICAKDYLYELKGNTFDITCRKYFFPPSSARRAANRVAKKLGLEVEWEKEER